MANDITTLRVKAERLGTISEVKQLLSDFETAYNSIYAFDFITDSLSNERDRRIQILDRRLHEWRIFSKEFIQRKDFSYDPTFLDFFWSRYVHNMGEYSSNLLELQSKLDINKIVLPSDKLIISKVNIQSPGFWEFLGSLNPLQQIREFLKDRHERKKDKQYRSKQEEQLGDLSIQEKRNTIITQKIDILRSLGYNETEIRQFVISMVVEPLNQLGRNQDIGQIEGIEE